MKLLLLLSILPAIAQTLPSKWEELTAEDIAAIEESERQFERGEGLDWRSVSQQLRAKYLKR